jgi:hypothetical protein
MHQGGRALQAVHAPAEALPRTQPTRFDAVELEQTRRHPADFCPHLERPRPRGTVLDGGDVVAAEMEKVVDLVVGGKVALRLARRLEALHLPLSSSRRLAGFFLDRQSRLA